MKRKLTVMFSSMFVLLFSHMAGAGSLLLTTPRISISPASVNFGNVKLGGTSGRTVTVKNTGTAELTISAIEITGTNASEFNETDNCATVAAGSFCAVNVNFNPTVLPYGKKAATMTITSNDPRKPAVTVKLSGNTPPPKISISPASINFKTIQAGSISPVVKVTVKNTGTSDLAVSDINFSGSNASEFNETDDCAIVVAGGACGITVTFVPTSAGSKSAVLSIASTDPKKPTGSVKLSGKATSPPPGESIWDSTPWDDGAWSE